MAVTCKVCGKIFSCQSSLNRHFIEVHKLDSEPSSYEENIYAMNCLEGYCNASFKTTSDLRKHLKVRHQIDSGKNDMTFTSLNEFKAWLSNEERENNVQYTKQTGSKKCSNGDEITYLYCVRSGFKQTIQEYRKRFPRSQGSCKVNRLCTSQIIINNSSSKQCQVTYFKQHYGHDNEVQHLRIQEADKEIIASQLMIGVPATKVLDTTRTNISTSLKRAGIITRKDITNIKCEINKLVEQVSSTSSNRQQLLNEINVTAMKLLETLPHQHCSEDQLKIILKDITHAKTVLDLDTEKFNMKMECAKEPHNKKNVRQKSFHSCRKKNKPILKRRKPNCTEVKVIKETLTNSIYVSVDPKNDHSYFKKLL